MLGIFSVLGAIFIGKELIKESLQEPFEPGSIDNIRLFRQDQGKVYTGEMTQAQLDRNIRMGKYKEDHSPKARAAKMAVPIEDWSLYGEDLDKVYKTKEMTKEELQRNRENGKYLIPWATPRATNEEKRREQVYRMPEKPKKDNTGPFLVIGFGVFSEFLSLVSIIQGEGQLAFVFIISGLFLIFCGYYGRESNYKQKLKEYNRAVEDFEKYKREIAQKQKIE